jgi:hypothetical protein
MPPRQQRPTDLTINLKSAAEAAQISNGPNSSPINLEGVDLSSFGGDIGGATALTSLPPLPSSPPSSPRHNREPSKNFLRNIANRSQPDKEQARGQIRQVQDERDVHSRGSNGSNSMAHVYKLRKNVGSSPELTVVGSTESVGKAAPGDGE